MDVTILRASAKKEIKKPETFLEWAAIQTLDAGRWTLDAGRWTLDAGRWTLDAGTWCWSYEKHQDSPSASECSLVKFDGYRERASSTTNTIFSSASSTVSILVSLNCTPCHLIKLLAIRLSW